MLEHLMEAVRMKHVSAPQFDAGLLTELTREADTAKFSLSSVHPD